MSTTATVERKVVANYHAWYEPRPTPMDPFRQEWRRAPRGTVIDVTQEEADRGEELGTLGPVDADVAPLAPVGQTADALLDAAKVAGILGVDGQPVDARVPLAATPAAGSMLEVEKLRRQLADAEARAAGAGTAEALTDAGLAGMSAREVIAHLSDHPDEVDRVERLELARPTSGDGKQRSTVLDAIATARQRVGDAGDGGDDGTAGIVEDEALAGMTAAEAVAYLNQHPDEADRVDEFEGMRDARRPEVEAALAAHRNAADEAAAEGARRAAAGQ